MDLKAYAAGQPVGDWTTKGGKTVRSHYRQGRNDFNTCISILQEDEYFLATLNKPGAQCIDIGSFLGGFALLAASYDMSCVAVEVLPENVALIEANVALNGYGGKITVLPWAIGSESDETVYASYNDPATEVGRVHEFVGHTSKQLPQSTTGREVVAVETISLKDIFHHGQIDHCHVLKIDCEGAEWDCFANVPDWVLDKINYVVGEVHNLTPERTYEDFLKLFRGKFDDISGQFGVVNGGGLRLFVLKNKNPQ